MGDAAKLREILSNFIRGSMGIDEFCDSFTVYFNQETDYATLTDIEQSSFGELCDITARFSPFEEDLEKYDCYYSSEQVRAKATEVWERLTH